MVSLYIYFSDISKSVKRYEWLEDVMIFSLITGSLALCYSMVKESAVCLKAVSFIKSNCYHANDLLGYNGNPKRHWSYPEVLCIIV